MQQLYYAAETKHPIQVKKNGDWLLVMAHANNYCNELMALSAINIRTSDIFAHKIQDMNHGIDGYRSFEGMCFQVDWNSHSIV